MNESPSVDLVGVGLNATDTVIPLAEFPACGTKVEYSHERVMPGGQVASAVVACQSWGLKTRYVGKLGDDDAARLHAGEFARAGVETHLIQVAGAASPRSLILVDPTGERTVLCRRDERVMLRADELQREWIVRARALLIDGHDTEAALLAAQWAREAGVPVVADLDDVYPGVERLIENIDYLIVSRDFPSRLMAEPGLKAALSAMQRRFGCRLTAATLGPAGVLTWDGERFCHRTAYRVPVVDTTGAGDIFHAGFLYGLLQGWEQERRLDFACAAAAINCMAEGARGGIQTVAAIEEFMATQPRYEDREIPAFA
ncbi:MAG TPA: PfkB family carbohydrate kinase [Acidobacteriaceae bacterium]